MVDVTRAGTAEPTAPEGDGSERPLRADAKRNRERILSAAEEVFSSEGIGAPIDCVAERAGVGVGTIYRHFPDKERLLEAILVARLGEVLAEAKCLGTAEHPTEALFSFLDRFAALACAKHDLMEALGSAGIDIKSKCEAEFDSLLASIDTLVARAADEGGIRRDVSAKEVVALVIGACHAGSLDADSTDSSLFLRVVFDGLRAR